MLFAVLQMFILVAISAAAASTPAVDSHPPVPMPIVTGVSSESLAEDERAYKEGRMSEERVREEERKDQLYKKVGTERGGLTPEDGQVSSATTLGVASFGGLVAVGVGLNFI
ncbi:uncharacterized protein H6S33_010820 [Morchella sextelata]|jgi:hypothetical protein|uniref:uncharacterized protein n=1 Tax=Morchella sextelata TaxID=1174677 RepID=UPI001D0379E0|nr:uncharacterized protein H6S33_010820 [Morchella sextelata]KAH0611555.1 hypothetical protein H6S33_010820 [Morchella sextelata]